MKTQQLRRCYLCKDDKPVTDFYTRTVNGKRYPASICKKCNAIRKREWWGKLDPNMKREIHERRAKYYRGYLKHKREDRAWAICYDSKKTDAKSGLKNDLEIEFVRNLVLGGCSYCGIPFGSAKISLDRIDNALGHLKTNVIPSCVDCNTTRGNMPSAAWLLLTTGLRQARQLGLLKGWSRHGR